MLLSDRGRAASVGVCCWAILLVSDETCDSRICMRVNVCWWRSVTVSSVRVSVIHLQMILRVMGGPG